MQGSRTDAGAALLAEQATPNGNGSSGGLTLQVMAELSANLGRVAKVLEQQQAKAQRAWAAIRPIPGIPVGQLTAASKFLTLPELAGPREGYWWDIHSVLAASFTGGTVNLYRAASSGNLPDINIVGAFTQAGYLTYGKAQLLVPPNQYLVWGSSSTFTGTANCAVVSVTEIAADALPDYLL